MKTQVIDTQSLEYFTPFQSFTRQQLNYISLNSRLVDLAEGMIILELSSDSTDKIFLLEGTLKLLSLDNSTTRIKADTAPSKMPVAQLRPSRYKVSADTWCKILIVEDDVFKTVSEQSEEDVPSYDLTEGTLDEEEHILYELIIDLQQGNFMLPSLPRVAVKIREMIADENAGANEIAQIIMTDPAIAAKVVRASNSAMYQRRRKAEDCKTAVVGLGTKVTAQLVTAFTMKELFKSPNKLLNKYMNKFWEHSIEIASISSVLGKITPGVDAEHALLAGLVHDIGYVAIMNKVIEYPKIMNNEAQLKSLLSKMCAQVSSSILQFWEFSDELIESAKESENWLREGTEKADLADVINIAHLHSFIGTARQKEAPIINQVPAFHKMALGQLTPELSIKLLDESRDKINQIKAILKM